MCSTAPAARCWTSAAAPGATSTRSPAGECSASASTSPRSRSLWPGEAVRPCSRRRSSIASRDGELEQRAAARRQHRHRRRRLTRSCGASPDCCARGGAVLVELDPPGVGVVCERVRLEDGDARERMVRLGAGGRRRRGWAGARGRPAREGALARRRPLVRGAPGAVKAPPGPDPRELLAQSAARAVAHDHARLAAAAARARGGGHGLLLATPPISPASDATLCSRRAACSRSASAGPRRLPGSTRSTRAST